jgi:dipeptidyl-peptidase 4
LIIFVSGKNLGGSMIRVSRLLGVLVFGVVIAASGIAAGQTERPHVTPEWIYGEGSRIAEVPRTLWLDDGTAILYDTRMAEGQRTFEQLDPVSGQRWPALDMAAAVASLKAVAKDSPVKVALPWPVAFDGAGTQALYEFNGDIFLLDLQGAHFTPVTETAAEEKDAEFSPDGHLISFVRENDLYVYDIKGKKETRLTSDGSMTTLNGTLSWVYWEEVMGRRDTGYWWSPDSQSVAYLQTDESGVPVSTFVDFAPAQERVIHQVYPKPGDKNPRVRVGVVSVQGTGTRWVAVNDRPYEWLFGVKWLPDSSRISFQTLDRPQTNLGLYFADVKTGASKRILTETDPYWINVSDDLYFLKDGKQFLWASERDGYMHLYRYQMDGTPVNQVTKGDWAIASAGGIAFWVRQAVVGVDDWIYFTALKDSSIERNLYRVKADGSGLERLTTEAGTHRISMSPNTRYYFDQYSNIRMLPALGLYASDGKLKETLAAPRPGLLPADMQYPELLTIPAADGFRMPAQILKPKNFDPTHKYPVILYVYGGPSAPTVSNAWQASLLANQMLLEDGYVVVGMDNRAATAIGKKYENTIGANPGIGETADLLAGVRWLKAQPWTDGNRFGVWGWSGGGTMTLNLMTQSKEFKAGIAGAPVTDWRYYDSKWAESLAKLPADNPTVYDRTSLVKHAGDLSGHLMLIYGTHDDNVHPQNEQAFMNELIQAGTLFEVMTYPMRKHGFTDTAARIHLEKVKREFWRKNL